MSTDHAIDEAFAPGALLTVTELAQALGVTARAIRFYEAKGLITPERAGGNRVYSRRDYVRMTVILRGKRLGFTLKEIKTYLDLYDADPAQRAQMQQLVVSIRARRAALEEQQKALTQTLQELDDLEREARDVLEHGPAKSRRHAAQ